MDLFLLFLSYVLGYSDILLCVFIIVTSKKWYNPIFYVCVRDSSVNIFKFYHLRELWTLWMEIYPIFPRFGVRKWQNICVIWHEIANILGIGQEQNFTIKNWSEILMPWNTKNCFPAFFRECEFIDTTLYLFETSTSIHQSYKYCLLDYLVKKK